MDVRYDRIEHRGRAYLIKFVERLGGVAYTVTLISDKSQPKRVIAQGSSRTTSEAGAQILRTLDEPDPTARDVRESLGPGVIDDN